GEVGGEGLRILVEQEVDRALAEQGDRPGAVPRHGGEAELAQVVGHGLALPGRRGELDELEAVDAHRVLEGGGLHAQVRGVGLGLRVHGDLRCEALAKGRASLWFPLKRFASQRQRPSRPCWTWNISCPTACRCCPTGSARKAPVSTPGASAWRSPNGGCWRCWAGTPTCRRAS